MKRFFLLSLFIIAPLLAAADFSEANWKYERPINVPEGTTGFVPVKLDRAVSAGSAGLRDIRIMQGKREVPYQLSVETAEVRAQYISSQVIGAGVDSQGRLQFVLDLGQSGTLHSRLHLETGSENHKRQGSGYAASSLPSPITSRHTLRRSWTQKS